MLVAHASALSGLAVVFARWFAGSVYGDVTKCYKMLHLLGACDEKTAGQGVLRKQRPSIKQSQAVPRRKPNKKNRDDGRPRTTIGPSTKATSATAKKETTGAQ